MCFWPSDVVPIRTISGLDAAGVKTDKHGYIEVDDELRTSVPGSGRSVTATAAAPLRTRRTTTPRSSSPTCSRTITRRVSDRITTYGLFIDPPLGRAGMTEAEVRATGKPALVGTRAMKDVKRAVEKGETAGLIKIVVDAELEADSRRRDSRNRRRRSRCIRFST